MRVIYTSKRMSKKFGVRVIYRKIRYFKCSVETCRSVMICEIIVHLSVIAQNRPTFFTFLEPELYCQILKLPCQQHATCHFFKHWDDTSAIYLYSGITSKKSPSFCVATFTASLKNTTALLSQSHGCCCYLSRRKLTPLQFLVAETHWSTRTFPTCDIGLDSPMFPAPEAGDFLELILLYCAHVMSLKF